MMGLMDALGGDLIFGKGGQAIQSQQLTNLMNILDQGQGTIAKGQQNLAGIIGSQGRTDPRLLNRMLTSIDRGTEQQQQALQGRLGSGLQGSGLGQALMAAIGQGGQERRVGAIERDIGLSEQRKRSDLGLILQQLINPQFQGIGQQTAIDQFNQQLAQLNKAANMQFTSDIFGSIMGAVPFGCWVARAVYGEADPTWLVARHYVMHLAPSWFRRFYMKHGERIAETVKRRPWMRRALRPLFNWFVKKAREGGYGD